MKATTAYALIWISVAVAISIAIITLKTAAPLWGFFIPAIINFKTSENESNEETEEKK